jgi:hypothetical protein
MEMETRAPACESRWSAIHPENRQRRFEGRDEIVLAVSSISSRPSAAPRRDENSWTQGQTKYRKGPTVVRAVRKLALTCRGCDG